MDYYRGNNLSSPLPLSPLPVCFSVSAFSVRFTAYWCVYMYLCTFVLASLSLVLSAVFPRQILGPIPFHPVLLCLSHSLSIRHRVTLRTNVLSNIYFSSSAYILYCIYTFINVVSPC